MKKVGVLIILSGLLSFANAAFVSSVTVSSSCPNAVSLTWIGTASVGFNVYRSTILYGTKTFVGATNGLTKSGTDVNAVAGSTYYYWVEAVDNASTYMAITAPSTTVPTALATPYTPTANISGNAINVSWSYYGSLVGMYIYRSADFGTYAFVKTIASSYTTSWVDNTVLAGHSYSYKISAYSECGETSLSYASATLSVPTLPDLKPNNLVVTVSNDTLYGQVTIENNGEQTAGMFLVSAFCNGVQFATARTTSNLLGGGTRTFTFTYKATTPQNTISVYADYNNEITESNENNNYLTIVKTAQPTSAPTLFLPTNNSINNPLSISLSWFNLGGANGYHLQITKDPTFNTVLVDNSTLINTSFSISNLDPSSIYYWRVYAINGGGNSSWSTIWTFTTIPQSPTLPTLTAPLNNSGDQQQNLTLTWENVSGATTYRVQVSTDAIFGSIAFDDSALVLPTKSIGLLSASTKYYWHVYSKNAGGKSTWSETWNFTTVPPATGAPILSLPINNGINQPVSLTATWNTVQGATTYHLQIAKDVSFASIIVEDSALTTSSRAISSLSPGTHYFWRVNVKNPGGTSLWSEIWSFTTVPAISSAPVLLLPIDNCINQPISIPLSWNSDQSALTYRLQVASDAGFTAIISDDSTLTVPTKTVGGLMSQTQYFWRVNAKNPGGTSVWSAIWNFTTVPPSTGAPILFLPLNNSVNQPVSLSLAWNAIQGAITYRLQVASDVSFATIVEDDSMLATPSKTVVGLAQQTQYFWRVNAKNLGGTSVWSEIWNFVSIPQAPSTPNLLLPFDGAKNVPRSINMTWTMVESANSYCLQVAIDSLFASIIVQDSLISDTSKTVTSMIYDTKYFWRVNATNSGGVGFWSKAHSFTTIVAVPASVILRTPVIGDTIKDDSTTLTWYTSTPKIDRYWVEFATDSLFSNATIDSAFIDTVKLIRNLQNNSNIWWHVRAHNSAGWSAWSTNNVLIVKKQSTLAKLGGTPKIISFSCIGNAGIIQYSLPKSVYVSLRVYSIKGQLLSVVINKQQDAGYYTQNLQKYGFAPGSYMVVFRAGEYQQKKVFHLMR